MATYTNPSTLNTNPRAPGTAELLTACLENPVAIAELATGAPIPPGIWVPYDMEAIGDGADGLIYDHAVDGTVASVSSPTFVVGWDYFFYAADVSHDGGGTGRTLDFSGVVTSQSDSSPSTNGIAGNEITYETSPFKGFLRVVGQGVTPGKTFETGVTISWSANSIDAGKIYMFKRRAYE